MMEKSWQYAIEYLAYGFISSPETIYKDNELYMYIAAALSNDRQYSTMKSAKCLKTKAENLTYSIGQTKENKIETQKWNERLFPWSRNIE